MAVPTAQSATQTKAAKKARAQRMTDVKKEALSPSGKLPKNNDNDNNNNNKQ